MLKNALILSAGFGTRMGEVGKKIPKPLWPIFESNMLGVHIKRLKKMGVENIYINTHYYAEMIEDWIKKSKIENVTVLHEKEILGSGGAVHNLKKQTGLNETVFCVNADVFYLLKNEHYQNALDLMKKNQATALLFAVNIDANAPYNRLKIENDLLTDIVSSSSLSAPKCTYSGVGIVDLSKLELVEGKSSFFNTVANYKEKKVSAMAGLDIEYWDFGTLEMYIDAHFRLLSEDSSFKEELIQLEVIKKDNCYQQAPHVINLAQGHKYRVKSNKTARELMI